MVLEEGGIERLALVSLDDVLDEPVGELDEVLLCTRLRGDEPVQLLRGCAWMRRGWEMGRTVGRGGRIVG